MYFLLLLLPSYGQGSPGCRIGGRLYVVFFCFFSLLNASPTQCSAPTRDKVQENGKVRK